MAVAPYLAELNVVIDAVHPMKLCCAMSAAVGNYRVANQQGLCTACNNVLKAGYADFPVWGPRPANPTLARKLAPDVGVVFALYSLPQWTELQMERDLGSRGLAHGIWSPHRNQMVVLERPLKWVCPGTLCVVSPRETSGVRFLVGKTLPEFHDRQVTDADLAAEMQALAD